MSGEDEITNLDDRSDPFASITGLVNSDDTDLSQRVDEIVYPSPAVSEKL